MTSLTSTLHPPYPSRTTKTESIEIPINAIQQINNVSWNIRSAAKLSDLSQYLEEYAGIPPPIY